jgi:Cu(I)/Ag(I) efflux system periplasmic protein CusF
MTAHLFRFALAFALAAPSLAQQRAENNTVPATAASAAATADGEVRKVDKDARKLTIRHGEIKSLDMPPMTMVFQVKDRAILDRVKAGDRIRFTVEDSATGLVVTEVRPAP